jgi:hypothetical protein
MKLDAISSHETTTIIQHLAKHGRWKERRFGALVELARIRTRTGSEIQYTVTICHHLVVTGRAMTVVEAVRECNAAIAGRPRAELAGRAADPDRTGTPHLVRERHRHQARAGELWGEG